MTAQQLVDWNNTFKPGHPCIVEEPYRMPFETHTRGYAWLIGGNIAVVLVEGTTGRIHLDHIKMLETHDI
jgi:hypothetical protein